MTQLDKSQFSYFTGPSSRAPDEGPYHPTDVRVVSRHPYRAPSTQYHYQPEEIFLDVEMPAAPDNERSRLVDLGITANGVLDVAVEFINQNAFSPEQLDRLVEAVRRNRWPVHEVVLAIKETSVRYIKREIAGEDFAAAARDFREQVDSGTFVEAVEESRGWRDDEITETKVAVGRYDADGKFVPSEES